MSEQQQPWDASLAAQDFRYYRDILEHPTRAQGIEAEGIFEEATFALAMADPRTVRLTVETDGTPRTVPLLTPLELAGEQWNHSYFDRFAPGKEITHYSHLSPLYRRDPNAYLIALVPGLIKIIETNGLLLLESSGYEAPKVDTELADMAPRINAKFTAHDGPEGPATKHYHYAQQSRRLYVYGIGEGSPATSLEVSYSNLPNAIADWHRYRRVEMSRTLSQEDIEEIWDFYEPAHAELSQNDPVHAGFNEQEFTDVCESPDFYKFVYRKDGQIGNLCLLTDVRNCPWVNQQYFKINFPEKYEQGLVLFSPGIVSNPKMGRPALSVATMGTVGQVIAQSHTEPVISFACDTESRDNGVPIMSGAYLTRSKVSVLYLVPNGEQHFRMIKVANSTP